MNLKHLTDETLIKDVKALVQKERENTLKILNYLKEIEQRRLFSDRGYGSLFEFAVKELGYSDSAAMRRIHAARLLKVLPEIGPKIENGNLNLTIIGMANKVFQNEDINDPRTKRKILSTIENNTTKETQRNLLDFVTKPQIPDEMVLPVTKEISVVRLNLTTETLKLFEDVKNLLSHHRYTNDEVLKRVLELAKVRLLNEKHKTQAKLTSLAKRPCVNRYIPAIVKKTVYQRDHGRCTKCGSAYKVQYDHITPYSMGGETSIKNLRLLCMSCNQRRNL